MKYLLDMTTAKKPGFWKEGDPKFLPCETGKHFKDFDLIEDELPLEFVERAHTWIPEHKHYGSYDESLPVGFNRDRIKEMGAFLVSKSHKEIKSI